MSSANNTLADSDVMDAYDVIVIGGGPAGCASATLVAQAGHSVLLLERQAKPQFKVGESLIPASFETLERMGMIDQLRASRFPKKYSVQFFSGSGKASSPFYFHETDPGDRSQTWQVLRSEFDGMLLDNARRQGVDVRQGAAVKELLFDGPAESSRAVGVRASFDGDEAREISSKVLMDATGQRAMIARQLGIRQHDACLRMAAIYTHFEGAQRDPGIDEGATLILQTEDNRCWFWYIPLPDDRVSVGVVGPIDYLIRDRQGSPQTTFDQEVQRCPGLAPRLTEARQSMDIKVINDFSYTAERAAGDGWALVGDAFGFLDPIYSSGMLLALKSGELAADATIAALAADDPSAKRLGAYEPALRAGMASFRQLIYAFYTPDFNFARFLKRFPQHRLAIVDILIGDVFDRDFTTLFEDLRQMISTPSPTSVAGVEGTVSGKAMTAAEGAA